MGTTQGERSSELGAGPGLLEMEGSFLTQMTVSERLCFGAELGLMAQLLQGCLWVACTVEEAISWAGRLVCCLLWGFPSVSLQITAGPQ